jgi:hypothetical protein
MERTITGFEAAPQGQIGSGLAQVFDTTGLVNAAMQMKQMRQQQYNALVESLSDIDPNLARPNDSPAIIEEFGNIYEFLVENYEDIANPMRNPEKAIEFKRKKNVLLRAVNASQAMAKHTLRLSEELPKNDLYMGMFAKNKELIDRINNTQVMTRGEDGVYQFNKDTLSLVNETLTIGKDANDFAIELSDKMKPQFDADGLAIVNIQGEKIVVNNPKAVTDADLDRMIDASLAGNTADAVAVTNSIIGLEVPYDLLSDAEKAQVRDTVRPLFAQRLDTKGDFRVVGKPSTFGATQREFNMDTRIRSLTEIATGQPNGLALLTGNKWGQGSQIVTNASYAQEDDKVKFIVQLKDGDKVSQQDYTIGKVNSDGTVSYGADAGANFEQDFLGMLNATNVTLNATQGGDVKTPDMEFIMDEFKRVFQGVTQGGGAARVTQGDIYDIGGRNMTQSQVVSELSKVAGRTGIGSAKRVQEVSLWMNENNLQGKASVTPSPKNSNVIVLTVGNSAPTPYDVTNPEQLEAFSKALVRAAAIPTGQSAQPTQMRFRGATGGTFVPQTTVKSR